MSENGIARRTLLGAATALASGLTTSLATAQMASPVGAYKRGKDRAFLVSEDLRNVEHEGRSGFQVKVRLTSYRSLPLSCIEGITLKVDGEEFDPHEMVLTLNHYSHKLEDLRRLSNVWWFILDYGDLFVPRATPLAPGEHEVEGTLITVEPYMTAGRFSFHSPSKKRLGLEEEVKA